MALSTGMQPFKKQSIPKKKKKVEKSFQPLKKKKNRATTEQRFSYYCYYQSWGAGQKGTSQGHEPLRETL